MTSKPATFQPRRLSEDLTSILEIISEHPIRIRELIAVMKGRAYNLLLILLALPFCLPIPLPGLSTVLGSVIALIGLRLSLRKPPMLPERMLDTQLSPKMMIRVLTAARRVATSFEYLLRPRWSFLVEWPVLHQINGAMICISGILLLLPLPIPFSNLLPAITIISLAAAMMERDGYFVVLGTIAFLGNIVFFGAIAVGGYAAGYAAIDFLMEYFKGIPAESFPGD